MPHVARSKEGIQQSNRDDAFLIRSLELRDEASKIKEEKEQCQRLIETLKNQIEKRNKQID